MKRNEPTRTEDRDVAGDRETGREDQRDTRGTAAGGSFAGSPGGDADGEGSPEEVGLGQEAQGPEAPPVNDDLAAQYLDQLQRLRAEFDNYRKRTLREKELWWRQAKSDLLTEMLPVLDDVTRARSFTDAQGAPDAQGLLQILKKLVETLTQLGLELMETEPGTPFDPELHEALMTAPSAEIEEGRIMATLDNGYVFEGQILRRSRVSVSAGPPEDD